MRDLGVLKERIEYAERHLKAAHTARERESDALMSMWTQIRDRFDAQEAEIARYRQDVADLTKLNDELSAMVDRLIASVEGSVEESASEVVPEVAQLAGALLKSEPSGRPAGKASPATATAAAPARAPAPPPAPARAATPPAKPAPDGAATSLAAIETDDPLGLGSPIDDPLDEAAAEEGASFGDLLNETLENDAPADVFEDDDFDDLDLDIPAAVAEESSSTGIRDLIARIEGSVKAAADKSARDKTGKAGEPDDELSRELREIEALRNELSGLHDKVSR